MQPDQDAIEEFRRIWRNILTTCLGWDDAATSAWIGEQLRELAHVPLFYNHPPAYYVVHELIPTAMKARLSPAEYQQLWIRVYGCLESKGHWNDFSDAEPAREIFRDVQAVLREYDVNS